MAVSTMDRLPSVLTALVIGLLLALPLAAEQTENTGKPLATEVMRRDFKVSPVIEAVYRYDDNIYAQHDDERSDDVYGLKGSLNLESSWDRHRFAAGAGFDSGRYDTYSSEDYDDYWLSAEGRLDLTPGTRVLLGAGYSREHEERSSPDLSLVADDPTLYSSTEAHALLSHSAGDLGWRVGATYENLDFDDNETRSGLILNNDDRDREIIGVGTRLAFRGNQSVQPFVQLSLERRDYDQRVDDYGYERSSHGYRLGVGATARIRPGLGVEGFVGKLSQRYDDGRFDRVHDVALDARLDWQLSDRSLFNLNLTRSLEETSTAGAAGYLASTLSAQLNHRISPRGSVRAGVLWGYEDYLNIAREDELLSTSVGYHHVITPRVYLDASYTLTQRDSSLTRLGDALGQGVNSANVQSYADFDNQILMMTLGVRFDPLNEPSLASDLAPLFYSQDAAMSAGFYAGVQAAREAFGAEVVGTRGEEGSDSGEFTDVGLGHGLFVGYGAWFGPWYLGVEGDYEQSGTKIEHAKGKSGSQTLEVVAEDSAGLDLRLGYGLPGNNLLYVRLGRVRHSLNTYNALTDYPEGAYDATDRQWGNRYGLGAEIPLNRQLFLRMDYSLTDFDSYSISYEDASGVASAAEYDPERSAFRIGLGWRPGGREAAVVDTRQHQGFYGGLLLGSSSLTSSATGTHRDRGGVSSFSGDFGVLGAGSLAPLIGYAWASGAWQIALELEAEALTADWRHERYPGGRNFNVEQKSRYGAGVRLGYRLDNGALLFALAGVDRARFNTDWIKGSNSDTVVERDDEVWGQRFGIGAELPLGERTVLRMDYSETDYDAYSFTTTQSQFDEMEFDNERSAFRLGLSHYF